MKKKRLYHIHFLIFLLGVIQFCHGQQLKKSYPFSELESPALVKFSGEWKAEDGTVYQLPVENKDTAKLALSYEFNYADSLGRDSLFLFFEGLSWRIEVELNDYYLGVFDKAFETWYLPVRREWFHEGGNKLKITLSQGNPIPYYPMPTLMMLNAPALVNRVQLEELMFQHLPESQETDTVGIIAPYYFQHSYKFDRHAAVISLLTLKNQGIEDLYFAFPPGRKAEALAAQMGFRRVRALKEEMHMGAVNFFPVNNKAIVADLPFWLDINEKRTQNFGMLTPMNIKRVSNSYIAPKSLLSLLILFPLFGLALIKIISTGYYSSMAGLLISPKLFIDAAKDLGSGSQSFLVLLHFIKGICLVCVMSMAIFYIQKENQWHITQIITENTLTQQLFSKVDSLFATVLKCFAVLMVWYGIKYFFLLFLGRIYGIKGFVSGIISLDTVGSFPLILFLAVPMALIIFSTQIWGGAWFWVGSFMVLIYLIRKMYVFYIGLERLFSFSYSMKFLYICAFIILPYIIWF